MATNHDSHPRGDAVLPSLRIHGAEPPRNGNASQYSTLMAEASLRQQEGDFPTARRLLIEAVELAEKEFGPSDKRVAVVSESLATVCRRMGWDDEARRSMERAVNVTIKSLRRRGRQFAKLQKYAESEQMFREAIQVVESHFGPRHREAATGYINLAACLRRQSKLAEAMDYGSKALTTFRELGEIETRELAYCQSEVGFIHRVLGNYAEADALLSESLSLRRRILPSEHPDIAESLDRLAMLRKDQGHFDDAEHLCQQALTIRESKVGRDHPLTAASLNNLALIRERQASPDVAPPVISIRTTTESKRQSPPKTTPQIKKDREDFWKTHAPGVVIITGLLGFTILLVVMGIVVPDVLWFVGLFVLIFSTLSAFGVVRLEFLIAWLAKFWAQSSSETEDREVLGSALGVSADIGAQIRKGMLTANDARRLARLDYLDLDHIRALTQSAADELCAQRGTLKLNGLSELRSKLARALRQHTGVMELNGIHELNVAAAAHIARHDGDLSLAGLQEVTREAAEHLAHHRGLLNLNGVRWLDEESAGWLIKHRGRICLEGLQLVSRRTAEILRAKPDIDLPVDLTLTS